MPIIRSMIVTKSGSSSMRVTLPGPWRKTNKIKHGDTLQCLEHGVLIIFPPAMDEKVDADKMAADIRGAIAFLKR